MSYVQPDTWCHQMMFNKRQEGHGQITVLLTANINQITKCWVHEKHVCLVIERSSI